MLERKILEYCRGRTLGDPYNFERLLPPKSFVVCALSGGADSVAMTRALFSLREALEISGIACAHFNHGLRGEASDGDQSFCEELCRMLDIPLYTAKANLNPSDLGGEAEYRRLRYDFLTKTAAEHGMTHITTAHTSDDNAETLLLNLVRGTGLGGLTGIPATRSAGDATLIRPLLTVSRTEVLEYLDRIGQTYRDDATNHTDEYRRNRIRRHVVPELLKENPRLLETLSRTSKLLKRDLEYIEEQAATAYKTIKIAPNTVSVKGLNALPLSLSTRVVRLMYEEASGGELSSKHVDAVLALCNAAPSAKTNLPREMLARRVYDSLYIEKTTAEVTFKPVKIMLGQTILLEGTGLTACWSEKPKKINNLVYSFSFNSDTIDGELTIRPRLDGDSLRIAGRGCTKTLHSLFVEKKIPKHERNKIPVLADKKGVVAVCGFGVDERCALNGNATTIQFYREEQQGNDTRGI